LNDAIEIEKLTYSYPDGRVALDNVSFNVSRGETVGIIGSNGAGKTTLLLHLPGILQGSGNLKIAGYEMNSKNLKNIRKAVGLVFQEPDDQLFMPTVFDDIAFAPLQFGREPEEIHKIVHEVLRKVGLSGFEERLAHHLSFGEKKRVAIAVALAMNPEILVFDEPTSNLDPHARKELIVLIKGLNNTKVIAGHDMEMIKETCTKVIVVNKGKVAAEGTPAEIFSNKVLLETNMLI